MKSRTLAALFVLAAFTLAGRAHAQAVYEEAPDNAGGQAAKKGLHDFSPIILPAPIVDPAVGNGLALAGGGLYQVGSEERPWITAIGGLYTDTKSYALALVQRANFGHGRFRVLGAVGGGEFNVDFWGIGQAAGDRNVSVPITQRGKGVLLEGMMRVAPNLFAGVEYRYIDLDTALHIEPPPFPDMDLPPLQRNSTVSAAGLTAEYDTRDTEFEPRKGLHGTATWLRASQSLGGDFDYSRLEAALNGYRGLGKRSVVAWRVSTCWAGDGAPFYDICNFGSNSDLRGYTTGQYRDHALFAAQAEYRRLLAPRWGIVAFAGIGGVGREVGEVFDHPLPATGIGVRFKASPKYDVNVGIDYALGKDSDAVYFRAGEAF